MSHFLFGLPLQDASGNPLPDSFFEFYIKAAVSYIEQRLDLYLRSVTITGERHDYIRREYENWGWLQLINAPILSVEKVELVLPSNQQVIDYDLEWVYADLDAGQLQLIPTSSGAAPAADAETLTRVYKKSGPRAPKASASLPALLHVASSTAAAQQKRIEKERAARAQFVRSRMQMPLDLYGGQYSQY